MKVGQALPPVQAGSRLIAAHNQYFFHSSPSSPPSPTMQGTDIQATPIPLPALIDIIRTNAFWASADISSGSRRWGRDLRRLSKHSP